MPDLAFSLLMVAGLGASEVRAAVQGLTIATVRAAVAMSVRDDVDKNRKRTGFLLELQNLQLLQKVEPTNNKKRMESHRDTLQRVEQFWTVAVYILEWCAPNNGMLFPNSRGSLWRLTKVDVARRRPQSMDDSNRRIAFIKLFPAERSCAASSAGRFRSILRYRHARRDRRRLNGERFTSRIKRAVD